YCLVLCFVGSLFAFFFHNAVILVPSECLIRKFLLGYFISPSFKRTFGKFHNVSFMNECNTVASMLQCIINACANETLRSFFGDWFYTNAGRFREADIFHIHFVL